MGHKGRGLAGRFRIAVEDESTRRQREEAEARLKLERAAQRRSTLFDDLVGFAEETGFLRANRNEGGLTLAYGERTLRFVPVGDADQVELGWPEMDPEETHRMYVEERLENAWVWARKRRMRPREDRELFWDAGLEELLVRALKLPRPSDEPAPQPEPEDDADGPRGRKL